MSHPNPDGEIIELINGIRTTVKKVGVKRFLELLKQIDPNLSVTERDKQLCDFIIAKTCDYKSVKLETLMSPKLLGDVRETRTMCIVLMKQHLGYSHKQISSVFGRSGHTLVSHAMRDFQDKDHRIVTHRKWLSEYEILNEQIVDYKSKLIQNG
jgi:chromosomal replication initiation ATPase DnaA